ncbi:hypothetical protein BDA99DRAFT_562489 [Phascolomyces articulosus]|uniref:Glycosyltransferase 2-like domain-containing protein n=1 Tax=Phascolomyces articulosus TaxID=60185 RepID=A0AAD5JV04_9FUNG|nr:hypothetical protein BDA99DRAFT_562489 [Phascolomyces articulosus]
MSHHLTSPSEWVAPTVSLLSLAILPLGPILFPRAYLILLFTYFFVFLYSQVNHLCKFYLTARRMRRTINKWNARLAATTPSSSCKTLSGHNDNKNNINGNNNDHHTTHHSDHHHHHPMVDNSIASTSSRIESPNLTRERMVDIEEKLQYYEDPRFMHAFIIPNYCEPEALLRDTIGRLASHRNAKTHSIIILAMEQSEAGYEEKGRRIQEAFAGQFLQFIVTGHPSNIPGESRGKGSNVAYAARHGCAELSERIDRRRVILTVTDSDSAIPELYVREMEDTLNKADDPYHLLLAPPIFFSRNCFEVPAAVRVTDITWSAMVMSNLGNSRGIAFPCSTYSLSMVLAERVGYWDTGADAVGEDMHMFLKCFFKTNGQARTVPIHVPINLTNVQTNGYLSNINARYIQAKRHYNGVADVAYTLRNAMKQSTPSSSSYSCSPSFSNGYDKLLVCLKVLEAHMIPVTSGWLMFAAVPLMQFILFPPYPLFALVSPMENPILTSDFYANLWNIVRLLTVFLPFPLFGTLAVYEHMHRSVDRELLRKVESRRWTNLFDYVTLPIAAWLFMTLPSTLACVKRLRKKEEQYIVAEKFFKDDGSAATGKIEALVV